MYNVSARVCVCSEVWRIMRVEWWDFMGVGDIDGLPWWESRLIGLCVCGEVWVIVN